MKTADPQTRGRRSRGLVAAAGVLALVVLAGGWWGLTRGRPWLYGLEAYVYGFPLVMMDITKDMSTAVATTGGFGARFVDIQGATV